MNFQDFFHFHFVDGSKWSKLHTRMELGKLIYLFNGNITMLFIFTKFLGGKQISWFHLTHCHGLSGKVLGHFTNQNFCKLWAKLQIPLCWVERKSGGNSTRGETGLTPSAYHNEVFKLNITKIKSPIWAHEYCKNCVP